MHFIAAIWVTVHSYAPNILAQRRCGTEEGFHVVILQMSTTAASVGAVGEDQHWQLCVDFAYQQFGREDYTR